MKLTGKLKDTLGGDSVVVADSGAPANNYRNYEKSHL